MEPRIYRRGNGYDAERYWRDRFARHGADLRAVGDEGLSVEENSREYQAAGAVFEDLLDKVLDGGPPGRVLEVGVGTGFYTDLVAQRGPSDYVGIDIADAPLQAMQPRYPDFRFERHNVIEKAPSGPFDLLIMIDVIEHIVTKDDLRRALANLESQAARDARLLVAPTYQRGRRHLYYVRRWTTDDILGALATGVLRRSVEFRGGSLLDIALGDQDQPAGMG